MKRYFLFIVMSLVLHTGVALAQAAQPREKSKVEVYMQQVAKGEDALNMHKVQVRLELI